MDEQPLPRSTTGRQTKGPSVRRRRPQRMLRLGNRLLLGLTSLALFAVGWYALTVAAVVEGGPLATLPSWWPGGTSEWASGRTWWRELRVPAEVPLWRSPQVVGAALLLVLALLVLVWQAGPWSRRALGVPGSGARLHGGALTEVVATDSRALPGVCGARVTVHGRPERPWLRLRLTLEADAQPGLVARRLEREVLRRARTGSGSQQLRASVRMRVVSRRPSRVRRSAVRQRVS